MEIFCCCLFQANERIAQNLKSCRSQGNIDTDNVKANITRDLVSNMGVVASHPLGL